MSLNPLWEIHSPSCRHTRKHTNTHTSAPFHLAHPNYPSMLTESFSGPGHSKRSPAAQCTFTQPQPSLLLCSSVGKINTRLLLAVFCFVTWWGSGKVWSPLIWPNLRRDHKRVKLVENLVPKSNRSVQPVWVSKPTNSLSSCVPYSGGSVWGLCVVKADSQLLFIFF